jgi:hypothetical protein
LAGHSMEQRSLKCWTIFWLVILNNSHFWGARPLSDQQGICDSQWFSSVQQTGHQMPPDNGMFLTCVLHSALMCSCWLQQGSLIDATQTIGHLDFLMCLIWHKIYGACWSHLYYLTWNVIQQFSVGLQALWTSCLVDASF